MRIRSILPDFYRSEDVAAMDWHTRLVFIGLWSYVDDNGVGRDNAKLVASDLFPLDGDSTETLRRVSQALSALSEGGQICRYNADGQAYLFVVNWDKYQRVKNPGKQRYPRPTSDNANPTESLRRPSVESPETLLPGEGEKGRRGEVLTTSSGKPDKTAADDKFEEFWTAYPRKEAKPKARQAWTRALKVANAGEILAGLRRFQFSDDPQFRPLPASWLNAARWADEQATANGVVRSLRPGQPQQPSRLEPWNL